jgi:hypothetical protein
MIRAVFIDPLSIEWRFPGTSMVCLRMLWPPRRYYFENEKSTASVSTVGIMISLQTVDN